MDERPPIPEGTKRAIRQRCGFACVRCGLPVYEYHHIEGWQVSNEAKDITLLCPVCHDQATKGLLSKNLVRQADGRPWSMRHNVTRPYQLAFSGKARAVFLGSDIFLVDERATKLEAVTIDGECILGFSFDGDRAFLNLSLYDWNGTPCLKIVDNEMVLHAGNHWDVRFEGKRLSIKRTEARNDYLLVIAFLPEIAIAVEKGSLIHNGTGVFIDGKKLYCPGFSGGGNLYLVAGPTRAYGYVIGPPPVGGGHALMHCGNPRRVQDYETLRRNLIRE